MDKILTTIQTMTFATPINGQSSWQSVNKKLKLWADVPPDQQPAAFLVTHKEIDDYVGLGLSRRRLELMIMCYSRSDNSIGQDDLDIMMDSFETSFGQNAVDNFSTNQNTLGGLVYWCRIEGKVFKDPGDIDNQTLLFIPLVVEMP
jgi:hypothetical protein